MDPVLVGVLVVGTFVAVMVGVSALGVAACDWWDRRAARRRHSNARRAA